MVLFTISFKASISKPYPDGAGICVELLELAFGRRKGIARFCAG
jgi:hypothetical protein